MDASRIRIKNLVFTLKDAIARNLASAASDTANSAAANATIALTAAQEAEITANAADAKADEALLHAAPVTSVNNKIGAVVLTASDVGAKPSSYEAPVSSVNNKTGAVALSASDVGALPDDYTPPPELFWVTYGTTTYAEIGTALANGKLPVCVYSGRVYIYTNADSTYYYFSSFNTTSTSRYWIRRSSSTWSNGSVSLASLSSPTFTGTPKAPTAASGTDTTQIATTAFVQQELLATGVLPSSTVETLSLPAQTTGNITCNVNLTKLGRFVMAQVAITVSGTLSTGDYTFPTLNTTAWPLRFRPVAQARQTTTKWPIALEGFGSLRISPGSTGNIMYQCGQAITSTVDTYINANLTYISAE